MAFIPNKIQIAPGAPPTDNNLSFSDVYVGVDTNQTYGPTSSTDWWNGYTVPTGGYVTYLNKGSIEPSIYMCTSDADLIDNVNQVFGAGISTINQALVFYYNQSSEICVNFDYDDLECRTLRMGFDFGYTPCYPRTNTSFRPFGKYKGNGSINNTFVFTTTGSNNQTGEVYFQNNSKDASVTVTPSVQPFSFKTLSIWYRPGTSSVSAYNLFECDGSVPGLFLDDTTVGNGFIANNSLISQDGGGFNALNNFNQYMFNDNAVHNIIITFNAGTTGVNNMAFFNDLNGNKGMNGSILAAFAWDRVFDNSDAARHYNALQGRLV